MSICSPHYIYLWSLDNPFIILMIQLRWAPCRAPPNLVFLCLGRFQRLWTGRRWHWWQQHGGSCTLDATAQVGHPHSDAARLVLALRVTFSYLLPLVYILHNSLLSSNLLPLVFILQNSLLSSYLLPPVTV